MSRYLGLDIGSKTVGVAVSDPFGWTAQGLETIRIDEEREIYGFDRLAEIIAEYDIKKVVVGLPKNMDGSLGFRAEASIAYAERLKEHFDLKIFFEDERLTTVQAERMMISEGNVSRKKRKKVIDKLAAVMILQNFLDKLAAQKG